MKFKTLLAASALALTITGGVAVTFDVAEARNREGRRVEGTVQTQRGTYQGQSEVRRSPGSRTRESTVTGPNGRETSVRDTRTRDREAGTASHDRVRTFGDGTTRTVEADAQRTGEGEITTQRQVTGRNGESRTQTGVFQTERTDTGRSTTGTITTENAGQVVVDRSVSRTENGRTATGTATFEDGTSISRTVATECSPADRTCMTEASRTGRQGGTTTYSGATTRSDTGATRTGTTTYADGTTRTVDAERTRDGEGGVGFTRTVTGRNGETRTQTGEGTVTPLPAED